jgi:hypothetical protein
MKDNLIPKGIYCYDKYGTCPYFTYLDVYDKECDPKNNIKPISIPYCLYLNKGSYANGSWKNNEFNRLKEHFKMSDNELFDNILPLDLLWDQCKECGVNTDDINDYINIYEEAVHIYTSDVEWEEKYDKIFSDEISKKVYHLFDWYDPDTSYEEDVTAFMIAFKNYIDNESK